MDKIVFIARGVSGSGKSTAIRKIPNLNPKNIFSADDLISKDKEEYIQFFKDMQERNDYSMMNDVHYECSRQATEAMRRGETPIVIDNTNLEAWNAKPYVQSAMKYGYKVEFLDVGTGGKTAEELSQRNQHGVPLDVIQKMIDKYNREGELTVDKVLQSKSPNEK